MTYRDAVLYAVVSELGPGTVVRFVHVATGTRLEVALPAQRAALVLLDRRDGRVLARYEPLAR